MARKILKAISLRLRGPSGLQSRNEGRGEIQELKQKCRPERRNYEQNYLRGTRSNSVCSPYMGEMPPVTSLRGEIHADTVLKEGSEAEARQRGWERGRWHSRPGLRHR